MKKYIIISFCCALFAFACNKNVIEDSAVQNDATGNLTTITCEFPTIHDKNGTKVSLAESGATGWQAGDKIVIYGKRRHSDSDDHPELDKVIHELTSAEVADPTKAVFSVDLSGLEEDPAGIHPYNAMYPADETDDYLPFYSPWGASGRTRFKDTNKMLMAGYVDGGTMVLQNLCAAITFKVSGDYDTYYFSGYNGTETVGYGQYLVELNNTENPGGVYNRKPGEDWGTKDALTTLSGPVNGNGTALNYIFIPISAELPNGFSIVFAKSGVKTKVISTKTALSLARGHMVNLGLLPSERIKDFELIPASEKAMATDLSSDIAPYKSANCYIVSAEGTTNDNKVFKFPTVQGNSFVKGSQAGTSVGSVVSAEVLWETWNSSTAPTAKSIIKVVEYKAGFIYFKTPETLHEGNALIAAKDSEGNILWSWHIWVPSSEVTDSKYGLTADGQSWMDRNLGALVVADASTTDYPNPLSYGLFYAWGRKDPFPGLTSMTAKTPAATTGSFTMNGSIMSLNDTYAHPTTFVGTGSDNIYSWTHLDVTSGDDTAGMWATTKTINDPCPPGYVVPQFKDGEGLWKGSAATGFAYDGTHMWVKAGSDPYIVFPIVGYIDGNQASPTIRNYANRVYILSSTNTSTEGLSYYLRFNKDGSFSNAWERQARAGTVRCVAE